MAKKDVYPSKREVALVKGAVFDYWGPELSDNAAKKWIINFDKMRKEENWPNNSELDR